MFEALSARLPDGSTTENGAARALTASRVLDSLSFSDGQTASEKRLLVVGRSLGDSMSKDHKKSKRGQLDLKRARSGAELGLEGSGSPKARIGGVADEVKEKNDVNFDQQVVQEEKTEGHKINDDIILEWALERPDQALFVGRTQV